LVSQQETGKITASIIPIVAGCHPARAIKTIDRGKRSKLSVDPISDWSNLL
jgi:hypothetical protein